MESTVLVGASGFIGRHLCELLESRGEPALVLTRNPCREKSEIRRSVQYADIQGACENGALNNCKTLVYMSSSGIPGRMWDRVIEPSRAILPNFAEILETALDANPNCQVVFLSSGGQIYGAGHSNPIPESEAQNPTTAYGLEKQLLENICEFLRNVRSANIATLRVSNPVGYWQTRTSHGFVTASIKAALDQRELRLFGNGSNLRDYLAVEELCQLILTFNDSNRGKSGIFNIGSGVGSTEYDVLATVERVLKKRIMVIKEPARPFDLNYSVLDVSLAKRKLNFEAQLKLEQIVKNCAQRVVGEKKCT